MKVIGTQEAVITQSLARPSEPRAVPTALERFAQHAEEYGAAARSPATRRAYQADLAHFHAWCAEHGLDALPAAPQTVALYLTALSERLKVATLARRFTAISVAHRAAGHTSPTAHPAVRDIMAGIRRTMGVAPAKKAALSLTDLRAMLAGVGESRIGLRDRALLLTGFAGGFRRSELIGLNVEDLVFEPEGVVVTLRRSKTDQDGAGRVIGLPRGQHEATCPQRALRMWMDCAGIVTGPLFRAVDRHDNVSEARLSDRAVALIVKRVARGAGLDAAQFAGHSLRAGLATAAAASGASERSIQLQTGHRSERVLRGYIRRGTVWIDNAASALNL